MVAGKVIHAIVHAVIYGKDDGLDEFVEAQASLKGPGAAGWWDRVLPELTGEQLESLEQAAANRSISHRAISIVLGKWGFKVSPAMVGHWRRTHV